MVIRQEQISLNWQQPLWVNQDIFVLTQYDELLCVTRISGIFVVSPGTAAAVEGVLAKDELHLAVLDQSQACHQDGEDQV